MADYRESLIIDGSSAGAEAALDRVSGKVASTAAAWTSRLGTAGKSLDSMGKKMMTVGRSATTYLTLPLVGAGIVATKMALNFDAAFTKISALADSGGKSIEQMKAKVISLAGETAQAPQDLAEALYFVSSAGLKANQIFPVLEASAKGAAAGFGSVEEIAQTLTSVMNAYAGTGLKAGNVMNIFAEAIKRGKAEASDFATGLGPVISAAAQANVRFEDLNSVLATATDLGVPFARAVTGTRYLLESLQNPAEEAKKVLDQYGISQTEIARKLAEPGGLTAVLQELAKTFNLSSVKGKQAWSDITGGARGAIVANTIVGKSAELANRNQEALSKSALDTANNFDLALKKMTSTDQFKFQQVLVHLKLAMIELGNVLVPVLTESVLPAVQDLAEGFSNLSPSVQKLVVLGLALAAAFGPVLLVFGGLFRIIGSGMKALAWLGGGSTGLAAVGKGATAAAAGTTKWAGALAIGKGAVFAADIYLIIKAIQGINDLMHQGEAEAHAWADALVEGKFSAQELGRAVDKVVASGDTNLLTDVKLIDAYTAATQEARWRTMGLGEAWDEAMNASGPLAGAIEIQALRLRRYGGELDSSEAKILSWALTSKHMQTALSIVTRDANKAQSSFKGIPKSMEGIEKKIIPQMKSLGAAFAPIRQQSGKTGQTLRQLGGQLTRMGGTLSKGEQQMIAFALASGKPKIAVAILREAIAKLSRTPATIKANYSAFEQAVMKVMGWIGMLNGQSVTIPITTGPPSGRGNPPAHRDAAGGILAMHGGGIVRKPTYLVGEGGYGTFAGRGAEAVIPLDSRGIGVIATAIKKAGGGGGQPIQVHVFAPPYKEWRRAVTRAWVEEAGKGQEQ